MVPKCQKKFIWISNLEQMSICITQCIGPKLKCIDSIFLEKFSKRGQSVQKKSFSFWVKNKTLVELVHSPVNLDKWEWIGLIQVKGGFLRAGRAALKYFPRAIPMGNCIFFLIFMFEEAYLLLSY